MPEDTQNTIFQLAGRAGKTLSQYGLKLVTAESCTGGGVGQAITDLTFSKKRIAEDVLKTLKSAIANAENNHGLDVDELVITQAYVGKNLVMKRGRPRARGRFGKILKPFSQVTIVVKTVEEQA